MTQVVDASNPKSAGSPAWLQNSKIAAAVLMAGFLYTPAFGSIFESFLHQSMDLAGVVGCVVPVISVLLLVICVTGFLNSSLSRHRFLAHALMASVLFSPYTLAFKFLQSSAKNAEVANKAVLAEVHSLVASDISAPALSAQPSSLAVAYIGPYVSRIDICDELCRRLLIVGAVGKVIMAHVETAEIPAGRSSTIRTPWPDRHKLAALSGTAFWLEKRDNCPPFRAHDGQRISLPPIGKSVHDQVRNDANPDAAFRLWTARGYCVMSAPAEVGEAEAIVAAGSLIHFKDFSEGIFLDPSWIDAWRMEFLRATPSGFDTAYRSTGVAYVLNPLAEWGVAFLRQSRQGLGRKGYMDQTPPLGEFLADKVGLTLRISREMVVSHRGEVIDAILSSIGKPDGAQRANVDDYIRAFQSQVDSGQFDLSDSDERRLLALLFDARFDLGALTTLAVQTLNRSQTDHSPELAKLLFARLSALADEPAEEGESGKAWRSQVENIAKALGVLPHSVLRPHLIEFQRLIKLPRKRAAAYPLVNRLVEFGTDALPLFEFLVTDAMQQIKNGNPEQFVGLAIGLKGLCKTGPGGSHFLPTLQTIFETADPQAKASFRNLLMATYVQMGMSADKAKALVWGDMNKSTAEAMIYLARPSKPGEACL